MMASLDRIRLVLGIAVPLIAFGALAADPAALSAANQRYQQERARCLSGQTSQDQETCLREAGAALQAARQGRPEDPPSDLERNRLQRCEVHTNPADREECIRRMQMGVTTGSVEGGGIVRELRTITTP
jgi:hypothetical protein